MKTAPRTLGIVALALSVAACSGRPAPVAPVSAVAPTPADEAGPINQLLLAGDTAAARKRIKAALRRDPMNASVQLLRDSLDRDPQELLGPQSYPYAVRAGDTIPDLAQRFLGNRLKAYQLGRYNTLKPPYLLVPGQALRIPGTPPRIEPARRPDPVPVRAAPSASVAPKAAPKPVAPVANPAIGRQFRAAGLAALNEGNVARAVGLLRRASAADPGNPLIARDLARAQRIAQTVRARR